MPPARVTRARTRGRCCCRPSSAKQLRQEYVLHAAHGETQAVEEILELGCGQLAEVIVLGVARQHAAQLLGKQQGRGAVKTIVFFFVINLFSFVNS